MARQQLLPLYAVVLVIFSLALTCSASTYVVGGTSGWDISTDLDTWTLGKRFHVGDVLLFQYSSSHSVVELAPQDFDGCNMSNPISSSSMGNTSIPLTTPGDRFFVCGNKLHCLGGMKLQVTVEDNGSAAPSPAPTMEPGAPGSHPRPSTKSNNPSSIVPSIAFVHDESNSVVVVYLGFVASLMWVAYV
ncbi:Phytocyanin domain [Dillenia turbinata]|uniref:Phytocyanin domain n=1 Tax=Dillenia turbinata TaxID=194707 RepID=A0AAN8USZ1_9MAGN